MDITSFMLGYTKGKASAGGGGGEGGGSCDDVRYVTFMNGDTVLYVKPVAVGDDCVDVLTKGLISTPTKESNVQYDYTYSGWGSADGGTSSSSVLKSVKENKTVYACFTSTVRKYTITYYDGDKVIKTEKLEYGSMPAYAGEKEGYGFVGWIPELAVVTGDASYSAQWIDKVTFANASWADIARISESGEARNTFSIGEERIEILNYDGVNYDVKLKIAGFDHDDLSDGSGKAGMTIMCHTMIKKARSDATANALVNYFTGTNAGEIATALFNGLPSTLREHAKSVTKQYATRGGYEKTVSTEEVTRFLPSPLELGYLVPTTHDTNDIGTCYELYTIYPYGAYKSTDLSVAKKCGVQYDDGKWVTSGDLTATRVASSFNGYRLLMAYHDPYGGGKPEEYMVRDLYSVKPDSGFPVNIGFCI